MDFCEDGEKYMNAGEKWGGEVGKRGEERKGGRCLDKFPRKYRSAHSFDVEQSRYITLGKDRWEESFK